MKHLWLILFASFSLAWAQDLILKKNNQTATIRYNRPVAIVSKDYNDYVGRFQKIEDNNIILVGSIIPISQVREIKLMHSEFLSTTGFVQGALTCGSLAALLTSLSFAAFFDSSGRDKRKLSSSSSSSSSSSLKRVFMYILPVAFAGGAMNTIRYSVKAIEATYKIDQDNWKIIVK